MKCVPESQIDMDLVQAAAAAFRRGLNLNLLGIDIIIDSLSGRVTM